MRKQLFAATLATIACAGSANASVVGAIWENDSAGAADPIEANVPTTAPNVTFTAPTVSFSAGPHYTIGEFLAFGHATILTGADQLDNSLANTFFTFTGAVSLTTGETFDVQHDDGFTLVVNGVTVASAPTPGFFVTPLTWNGPSGTFPFQIVYGEVPEPPAGIIVSPPLSTPSEVPVPGALPLFGAGLGGLGLLGWRRKRRRSVPHSLNSVQMSGSKKCRN